MLRIILLLSVFWLLAGCPEPTPPADDDDTAADDDDTTDDDDSAGDDDSAPLPALVGHVTAIHWAEDAEFDWPELHLHGVFADQLAASELMDAEDPLGLSSYMGGPDVWVPAGYWPVPLLGEVIQWDEADFVADTELDTLDAGDWIAAGDFLVANLVEEVFEGDGGYYYEQPLEFGFDAALQQPLETLDLEIHGGADVPPTLLPGAVRLPDAVEVTWPDPRQYLPMRQGAELELEWTPTAEPGDSILIVIEGENDAGLVVHAQDDWGSFVILPQELAPLGEVGSASVARVISTSQVIDGLGTVWVNAVSRVYLYAEQVGAWRVDPRVWPVGEELVVEFAWFDQALDPATAFVDAGPGVTVSDLTVVDSTGYRLQANVTVQEGAATGARTLSLGDASGSRAAQDAAWVVRELPEQGDCGDVLDEGALPDGAWVGNDGELGTNTWDTGACFDEPTGREQAVPVHLEAGERLVATLWSPDSVLPTLYLVDSCDGAALATECSQEAPRKPTTELIHTAATAEDLLLVVDSANLAFADAAEWVLDLRRAPIPAWIELDYVSQGSTLTTTAHSTGEVWSDGDVSFDFGADVTVTDVVVAPDGLSAALAITPAITAAPGERDLVVTTGAGARTTPAVLAIGRYLYTVSCTDAEATGPIEAGWHEGTTNLAAYGAVDGEDCLPLTGGTEALIPVALGPGETLAATVFPLDEIDIVLYVQGSCGSATLVCTDLGTQGGAEYIEWVAPPQGGTAWLIIDGYDSDDETSFLLNLEVRP